MKQTIARFLFHIYLINIIWPLQAETPSTQQPNIVHILERMTQQKKGNEKEKITEENSEEKEGEKEEIEYYEVRLSPEELKILYNQTLSLAAQNQQLQKQKQQSEEQNAKIVNAVTESKTQQYFNQFMAYHAASGTTGLANITRASWKEAQNQIQNPQNAAVVEGLHLASIIGNQKLKKLLEHTNMSPAQKKRILSCDNSATSSVQAHSLHSDAFRIINILGWEETKPFTLARLTEPANGWAFMGSYFVLDQAHKSKYGQAADKALSSVTGLPPEVQAPLVSVAKGVSAYYVAPHAQKVVAPCVKPAFDTACSGIEKGASTVWKHTPPLKQFALDTAKTGAESGAHFILYHIIDDWQKESQSGQRFTQTTGFDKLPEALQDTLKESTARVCVSTTKIAGQKMYNRNHELDDLAKKELQNIIKGTATAGVYYSLNRLQKTKLGKNIAEKTGFDQLDKSAQKIIKRGAATLVIVSLSYLACAGVDNLLTIDLSDIDLSNLSL